jgi:ATP-dependent Clp endopeptidase proteolytic subunit ClpP
MARLVKESIDRFYDYDIHVETRTLYIGSAEASISDGESGTDAIMAETAIKGLLILDSTAPAGDKPITVIMNNPGGDKYHGIAIFDAIKACKNHVTIKVFGHAMSMGCMILQAADKRILSPNSKVMMHYGTWGHGDHPKVMYRWAEEGKKYDAWMEQVIFERIKEKHPTFKYSKVKEMLEFDTILSAKEALELGLIDEILGEENE